MSYDRETLLPKLCAQLEEGLPLITICAERGFPNRSTIQRWCDDDPEIAARIARARSLGYEALAERAVENAKKAKDAALGRLAFDADRWLLSKIDPKRYGDRIQTAQTDVEGNDVEPVDPASAIASILASAKQRRDGDGSDLA